MTHSDRPPPFFIADHLALDFLNTLAKPHGPPVEWLRDGKHLLAWLEQAGVIEGIEEWKLRAWGGETLDEIALQARDFREWLRGFVIRADGQTAPRRGSRGRPAKRTAGNRK